MEKCNKITYDTCRTKAQLTGTLDTGIQNNSCLNALKYFHVANPGLPPCIAHDVFEGFVQIDMCLAINYFLAKGWFCLGLLNFRLNDINPLTPKITDFLTHFWPLLTKRKKEYIMTKPRIHNVFGSPHSIYEVKITLSCTGKPI